MRPSPADEIQMPDPSVTEYLLQPLNRVALRLIVDIRAHQIVMIGQVGVEGINAHDNRRLSLQFVGAHIDRGGQIQRFDGAATGNGKRLGVECQQLLTGHATGFVAE